MKKALIALLLLLLGGGGAVGIDKLGGSLTSGSNIFGPPLTMSSTTISVAASSTTVLFRSDDRQFASICNTSTTGAVYLHFSTSTNPNSGEGVGGYRLDSEQCYVINSLNLYTGAVQAWLPSSTDGGTTLIISTLEK